MRDNLQDRLSVQKWDEDHGISEKGTTAWRDARNGHVHDANIESYRATLSRLNEVDDESGQSKSVKRPFDLLKEEDSVDMEREFTLHLDCDPRQKSPVHSHQVHPKGPLTRLTLHENSDWKNALARGVKRSAEEDHREGIHYDILEIESLHTINVVTSKFETPDEQSELIARILAKVL